jgi:hypothetical protein
MGRLLIDTFFSPWRWRRYIIPNRRYTQNIHGATSQKTAFSIVFVRVAVWWWISFVWNLYFEGNLVPVSYCDFFYLLSWNSMSYGTTFQYPSHVYQQSSHILCQLNPVSTSPNAPSNILFLKFASCCVYIINIYKFCRQRNNCLLTYIALHISTPFLGHLQAYTNTI